MISVGSKRPDATCLVWLEDRECDPFGRAELERLDIDRGLREPDPLRAATEPLCKILDRPA